MIQVADFLCLCCWVFVPLPKSRFFVIYFRGVTLADGMDCCPVCRACIKELIEKIDLYPCKNRSGQWIKTIYFKFPMYYNDSSEADCTVSFDADGNFLPKGKTDETVVLMSRVEK